MIIAKCDNCDNCWLPKIDMPTTCSKCRAKLSVHGRFYDFTIPPDDAPTIERLYMTKPEFVTTLPLPPAPPAAFRVEAIRSYLYPLPDGTWSDTPPENWQKTEAK